MYIRRKVFSLLQDETGEERYFSTTDFELADGAEERYYSDDEDEDEDERKGLSRGAKVALGTGAGLAALGAGIYGGKKLGNRMLKDAMESRRSLANASSKGSLSSKSIIDQIGEIQDKEKLARKLSAPGDYVVKVAKGGKAKVVDYYNKSKDSIANKWKELNSSKKAKGADKASKADKK